MATVFVDEYGDHSRPVSSKDSKMFSPHTVKQTSMTASATATSSSSSAAMVSMVPTTPTSSSNTNSATTTTSAAVMNQEPNYRYQPKVIGNYSLTESLGKGSMGKVKLGVHSVTGDKVKQKIMIMIIT
jgi:hypothetical protein